MKKNLFLGFAMAFAIAQAQVNISFESNEGYVLGSINAQNGWEVTEANNELLVNQIITDEVASEGDYAFKNANEPEYNEAWLPIFGANQLLENSFDYSDFTISYDIMVTEKMGADFEFTAYSINPSELFDPILGFGFEYQGGFYVISSVDYDYTPIDGLTWDTNTWYNVKVNVTTDEIKYYLNDELIYNGENYVKANIDGFNMLHNNYGGSAYYDNIKLYNGDEAMSVSDLDVAQLQIAPNPAIRDIEIFGAGQSFEIYNLTGQKVMEGLFSNKISIQSLTQGVYILKVKNQEGKIMTKKFVKK